MASRLTMVTSLQYGQELFWVVWSFFCKPVFQVGFSDIKPFVSKVCFSGFFLKWSTLRRQRRRCRNIRCRALRVPRNAGPFPNIPSCTVRAHTANNAIDLLGFGRALGSLLGCQYCVALLLSVLSTNMSQTAGVIMNQSSC